MTVETVERAHELNLLAQLLDERSRPVPPPPPQPSQAPRLMRDAMRLIAQAMREAE